MSLRKCARCSTFANCNADGYCDGCASILKADGFGVNLHYGTCSKCGKSAYDLNKDGICGPCRNYYGL